MLELEATAKITLCAIVWLGLLLFTVFKCDRRSQTVGLPLAFLLTYTFAHGGALVHLVEGYSPASSPYLRDWSFDAATVAEGLEATTIGMIGAILGFGLADQFRANRSASRKASFHAVRLYQASMLLIAIGVATTLVSRVISALGVEVAGIQGVMVGLQNLFFVGACGYIYNKGQVGGEGQALIACLFFALVTPIYYLLTTAILADSVASSLAIVCFYIVMLGQNRNLIRRFTLFIGLIILSFAFSVVYMQSRHVIRAVVWGGGGVAAAFEATIEQATKFKLDSVDNYETLALIDSRLNQNIFVGLAIQHIRAGSDNFENGATLALSLLGWVPRFLWPDKPERGGTAFVSKHTGLVFAQGVTFGSGSVFEFYVNFGLPGVFACFILVGGLLRRFDNASFRALHDRKYGAFAQYLLMGFALLSPLAPVFFTVTSVGIAAFVGWGLRFLWSPERQLRAPQNAAL